MRSRLYIFLCTTAGVAVLDQALKALVRSRLAPGSVHSVIPGLLNIVYFRNTGSAFGILRGQSAVKTALIAALTFAAIAVIALLARRAASAIEALVLSLISGGAAGNLIDRLGTGSVVDFIDVHAGPYHWPAFNMADSAITTGVLASLVYLYLRERRGRRKGPGG